jgi:hypothetical protein
MPTRPLTRQPARRSAEIAGAIMRFAQSLPLMFEARPSQAGPNGEVVFPAWFITV